MLCSYLLLAYHTCLQWMSISTPKAEIHTVIAWHAHHATSVGPPSQLFHAKFLYYFNVRMSCTFDDIKKVSKRGGWQQWATCTVACIWVTSCLSLWCECFYLVLWREGKGGFVFHTTGMVFISNNVNPVQLDARDLLCTIILWLCHLLPDGKSAQMLISSCVCKQVWRK